MKIADILGRVEKTRGTLGSVEQKIAWLSELDGRIKKEIFDSFEGNVVEWQEYTPRDLQKELLVPSPFGERLYLHWLEAMIDYYNNEMEKYTNSYILFNNAYSEVNRYYIRNHMHKTVRFKNYGW